MENLNAEQIKKALECCQKDDCDNCPNTFGNCYSNLAGYALSLIKKLTKEVEDLKAIAEQYQKQFEDCYEENERLRAELAERPPKLIITKLPKEEGV